jgi:hypothetical protein
MTTWGDTCLKRCPVPADVSDTAAKPPLPPVALSCSRRHSIRSCRFLRHARHHRQRLRSLLSQVWPLQSSLWSSHRLLLLLPRLDSPWCYHHHRHRLIGSGKSRLETAEKLGITFEIIPMLLVDDGIKAAKLMFARLWIDEGRNAQLDLGMK